MQKSDVKYVICNGDEGDPGAFMDSCVMEGTPHAVLEGLMIAAKAIGATHGYVYVRTEYPLAVKRLRKAVEDARKAGILGENIFGSGMNFDIEIKEGAGAFVCGEETALIASIEGKRGMPSPKPTFPAEKGLFGKPTAINNVETLASIPMILRMGAKNYAAIGTEGSKGTKTFSLTGHVVNTGLIEIPFGPLRNRRQNRRRRCKRRRNRSPPTSRLFRSAASGGCLLRNISTCPSSTKASKRLAQWSLRRSCRYEQPDL